MRSEVCQNSYAYEYQVKEKITELGLKNSSAKVFKKGTVLIALVGATIGKTAYLTFDSATNQNISGIMSLDENKLNQKFLYHVLINDYEKNFGERKGKFTMANLQTIKNIEIPVPPIEEQKKIVSQIEVFEKAIEENQNILDAAKGKKEAILKKYLE